MQEPPPPDNFELQHEPESIEDYGTNLIESHVDQVETRDADAYSARVQNHRPARRRSRQASRRRSNRSQRQQQSSNDNSDADDNGKSQRSGILRYGIAFTIVISAVPIIAILLLFLLNSAGSPPPSVEIKPRPAMTEIHPILQAPPPAPPVPVIKQQIPKLPPDLAAQIRQPR